MRLCLKVLGLGILATGILASCTDLKKKYDEKLQEEFAPIKERFEYVESIYKNIDADSSCICFNNVNELPKEMIEKILAVYTGNEESVENYHPEYWMVFHNHFQGHGLYDEKSDDNYFSTEVFGEPSYYDYLNDSTIIDNDYIEYRMVDFHKDIVERFQNVKYILEVKNEFMAEPVYRVTSFESGCIYATVKVYDIATKQVVDTFAVVSENGKNVSYNSGSINLKTGEYSAKGATTPDLMGNLIKHHYTNVVVKAAKRVLKMQ